MEWSASFLVSPCPPCKEPVSNFTWGTHWVCKSMLTKEFTGILESPKWWDFILGDSKITADSDCSHEIKRCLFLGRKAMTKLDSILNSRDITLPTKVHLVKAMVFPGVMYGYESWTIKKAEHQRIAAFELWCWRRLLRVPGLQGDPISLSWRKSVLNTHWKDWCWSWNSNTLATWCEELTH